MTRRVHYRRRMLMRRGAVTVLFLMALGVLSALLPVLAVVLGIIVFAALALFVFLIVGTLYTRRAMGKPVPCRTCDGVGLIEYGPFLDVHTRVCEVCMGTGHFAPTMKAALARVDGAR